MINVRYTLCTAVFDIIVIVYEEYKETVYKHLHLTD